MPNAPYFFLQRRVFFGGGSQHIGNSAHLRSHACGGYHGQATAASYCRALVNHVVAVAQGFELIERSGIFQHRLALASKRSLLHAQGVRLQQPRISAHGIAFGQHQQIAPHQLMAGHAGELPITHHARGDFCHACQRGSSIGCLGFLQKAQYGIERHHCGND